MLNYIQRARRSRASTGLAFRPRHRTPDRNDGGNELRIWRDNKTTYRLPGQRSRSLVLRTLYPATYQERLASALPLRTIERDGELGVADQIFNVEKSVMYLLDREGSLVREPAGNLTNS